VLILTLIASYYIKFFKTKNPKDVLPFSNKSNILVFIPAYSENKDSLKKTLDSVVLNNYESESKCICLVVDGKIKGFQQLLFLLTLTDSQ
jgi:cellulose synthase/poly-beta-1,6-N-acetylglucosamine synthase-like glycosyltransferase